MNVPWIDALWYGLAALVVLVLPGLAWLAWTPSNERDRFERFVDGIGISVSLTALTALLYFVLGARFSGLALVSLLAACGFASVLGLISTMQRRANISISLSLKNGLGLAAGVLLLLCAVLWRFYQARTLVMPSWVDSVHHVFLVQKIMELGGLPATLDPEIPAFFSYHFGFHALAAHFAFWANAEPAQAVLWFGQVINALVGLSVYRLAKSIWGDWRRALLAALLVAFALQMPAYYVTWGRYTLLTGLLLLPLAMAAANDIVRNPERHEPWLRLLLLTTGVALCHYTTLLLLGMYLFVLLLGQVWKVRSPQGLTRVWKVSAGALGGLVLASPWLWRVAVQEGRRMTVKVVADSSGTQTGYVDYLLYLLGPTTNYGLYALAVLALIYAIFQRRTRTLAAWVVLILVLLNPNWLRLGPFRPDHMAIILFLPAALLVAHLVMEGVDQFAKVSLPWLQKGLQGAAVLVLAGGLIYGGWNTRNVINSGTVFTSSADLQALKWVRENTPPDARFFINTTHWQSSIYRGVDGGYWLLPLTKRWSILPPVLFTYGKPEYVRQIIDWSVQASKLTNCDNSFWNFVNQTDITHIYLKDGIGSLQPNTLSTCANLLQVYRRDGISIFEVITTQQP